MRKATAVFDGGERTARVANTGILHRCQFDTTFLCGLGAMLEANFLKHHDIECIEVSHIRKTPRVYV